MRIGDGEYIVSRSGDTGFIPVGKLRSEAVEDVNRYASERGLIPEIISVKEVPAGFGIFPQVDIRFRLVQRERNVSFGQPAPKPESKPTFKPTQKPEVKPAPKSEVKTPAIPELKLSPKTIPRLLPKPIPEPQPAPEA